MGRKRSKVAKVRSEQAGRTLRRGQAPGSAIYVGAPRDSAVSVRAFAYGPDVLEEREAASVGDLTLLRQRAAVTWLDLDGVHAAGIVFRDADNFLVFGKVDIQKFHCVERGFKANRKARTLVTVEGHAFFPIFAIGHFQFSYLLILPAAAGLWPDSFH